MIILIGNVDDDFFFLLYFLKMFYKEKNYELQSKTCVTE